mmetsp:Transcript_57824/g.146781  ORF Transcript_57824/g.146781 Transcript_57824/m.146781 type:complete len:217 (-) Transcript_57824:120-770(-)
MQMAPLRPPKKPTHRPGSLSAACPRHRSPARRRRIPRSPYLLPRPSHPPSPRAVACAAPSLGRCAKCSRKLQRSRGARPAPSQSNTTNGPECPTPALQSRRATPSRARPRLGRRTPTRPPRGPPPPAARGSAPKRPNPRLQPQQPGPPRARSVPHARCPRFGTASSETSPEVVPTPSSAISRIGPSGSARPSRGPWPRAGRSPRRRRARGPRRPRR